MSFACCGIFQKIEHAERTFPVCCAPDSVQKVWRRGVGHYSVPPLLCSSLISVGGAFYAYFGSEVPNYPLLAITIFMTVAQCTGSLCDWRFSQLYDINEILREQADQVDEIKQNTMELGRIEDSNTKTVLQLQASLDEAHKRIGEYEKNNLVLTDRIASLTAQLNVISTSFKTTTKNLFGNIQKLKIEGNERINDHLATIQKTVATLNEENNELEVGVDKFERVNLEFDETLNNLHRLVKEYAKYAKQITQDKETLSGIVDQLTTKEEALLEECQRLDATSQNMTQLCSKIASMLGNIKNSDPKINTLIEQIQSELS